MTGGPRISWPRSVLTVSWRSRASGTFEGHDAIREAYAGLKPRAPQRHVVVNTLVTDWTDHEAKAVSDLLFLQKGESGWAVQLVGRYNDTLRNLDGTWRFQRRTMDFAG